MAFSRRNSQNCGPSGGGIAAFGDGGLDAGGTLQADVVHVGGVATFDAAPVFSVTPAFAAGLDSTGRITTTDGVASGIAKVVGGRAYSAVSASDNLLASAGASAHVDFAQTLSIPADTLKAGTICRIRALIRVTDDSGTDTLETKLIIGSTTLVTTTAFDPSAATDWVQIDFTLIARAAPGATASCVGMGRWSTSDNGTIIEGGSILAPTNLATNGALIVKASAKWSSTTASTNANLTILTVEII